MASPQGREIRLIERWKAFAVKEENEETGEEEITGHFLRLVGCWNVFNASEIEASRRRRGLSI